MNISDFCQNIIILREVLIFFFHSKKTAAKAHIELQKAYGDATLIKKTCCDWFPRFIDSDFNVGERSREGILKTFEDADLEILIYENPYQT